MSGVVVIENNALAHGGCHPRRRRGRQGPGGRADRDRPEGRHGDRSRRRRRDDGLHDAARPPDHLRQRRPRPGDSMYDGQIYVGGKVRSLGIDCTPASGRRRHRAHRAQVPDLRPGAPPEFQKFVCGALQLRPARTLGKEAGPTTSDRYDYAGDNVGEQQPERRTVRRARSSHAEVINDIHMKRRARALPHARLLDVQEDPALGRPHVPPRNAHTLRHRGLPREVRRRRCSARASPRTRSSSTSRSTSPA